MEGRTNCPICKESVNVGAVKCTSCGSYQNKWVRISFFVASLAGFFSFMGSTSLYIYEKFYNQQVRQDPIEIIAYSYKEGSVFLNKSKDSIYIKTIFILFSDQHYLFGEDINMIMEPSKISYYLNPVVHALQPSAQSSHTWEEALIGKSKCFDVFITDSYFSNALRHGVMSIKYSSSYDGKSKEKKMNVGFFLKLKNKKTCNGSFNHPGDLYR